MPALETFQTAVRALSPGIAIVLGSGQSQVLSEFAESATISFHDTGVIPAPTVAGHGGQIAVGRLREIPVLVFHGRVHMYEGNSPEQVTATVRFATDMGIRNLLVTNAAGGIHADLTAGSMMIVRDHLLWQGPKTWLFPGPAGCRCVNGERPSAYSDRLRQCLREAGLACGERLHEGVYAAVTGPAYETPAEIRALAAIGADAVGMSTALEIEAGHRLGLECAALSIITNKGAGLTTSALQHAEVLQVVDELRPRLDRVISAFVATMGAECG